VSTQTLCTGRPKNSGLWHPVVGGVTSQFSKDRLFRILKDPADHKVLQHKPRRWRHSARSKHQSRTISFLTQRYSILDTLKSRTNVTLRSINQYTASTNVTRCATLALCCTNSRCDVTMCLFGAPLGGAQRWTTGLVLISVRA